MRRAMALAVVVLTSLSAPVNAATVVVDWSGGGDYLTIQEGMNAANNYDTVLVAPGTYYGPGNRNLSVTSKNLVIVSQLGPGFTTIDCEGIDRAFYFHSTGQDTSLVIRGFRISNGYTTDYNGAGIIFHGVGAIVDDCVFTDCVASHNGGAISVGYNSLSTPVKVRNCGFERNQCYLPGRRGHRRPRVSVHTAVLVPRQLDHDRGEPPHLRRRGSSPQLDRHRRLCLRRLAVHFRRQQLTGERKRDPRQRLRGMGVCQPVHHRFQLGSDLRVLLRPDVREPDVHEHLREHGRRRRARLLDPG